MSFKINWDCIDSDSFTQYATDTLNDAMNSGKRPTILADNIRIVDLNFGSVPPDFEVLEIGDLGMDRFRGIFKFDYFGDLSVKVTTKVSASLLKNYNANIKESLVDQCESDYESNGEALASFIQPNFIVSDCRFDIPLYLTLSKIQMSSIIVVVYSVTKGLTLVFKNDPLKSIEVNSTFDKIAPIANFLQEEIEKAIGELFREFLPSMLYKFSMEYTSKSFNQFHQNMVSDDQEEGEQRVMLKDVHSNSISGISPAAMMRLTRLSSSRQTLGLGGDLSCDRMNPNVVTKAFMSAVIASNNSYAFSRIHMRDGELVGVQQDTVAGKLDAIKDFQTRSYYKSNHGEKPPKRRTIRLYGGKKKKKNMKKQSQETAPVPATASNAAADMSELSYDSIDSYNDEPMPPPVLMLQENAELTAVPMLSSPSRYSDSAIHEDEDDYDDVTLVSEGAAASTPCPSRSASRSAPMSRHRRVSSSTTTSGTLAMSSMGSSSDGSLKAMPMSRRASNSAGIMQMGEVSGGKRPVSRRPSNTVQHRMKKLGSDLYYIGKDEQLKIKKRIVKLDRLLAKKYDLSEKGNPFYRSEPILDSPPPPYTQSG